ncbi:phage major capsid protein [Mycolicibacterium moriokaense]|uniref:Phage capsid-like C-terminal domain-containing protein n=1 Tax=Mycolicibacterium moriokaense TaxID=39691 RepID=A0AAD1H8M8_9MYCO|nr:phage major capsid protein [Mycolicibacterium moriokaense]BBX00805.1 hypothetical protein MMOR_17410 [Mycolicibacterium moriokaense]
MSIDEILEKLQAISDLGETRSLTDDEVAEYESLETELKAAQKTAELQQRTAAYKAPNSSPVAPVKVTEPATYRRDDLRTSYFRDFMRVHRGMDPDGDAAERLRRHAIDVKTNPEYRDLDRGDGTGGYAVPPIWLVSQYVELARAGRAYANTVTNLTLPPGTDSINIPKVLTGTATAIQTADNTNVAETDLTDTSVQASVRTIAGQQDVAIQLLDQSPISFDEVIFRDLIADYATKVDLQVISGSGASGQVLGVRNTSGITTIAATSGSDNVGLLFAKIADAVQRVHTQRFMAPTVIIMHPRRWAFFLAARDDVGRPLVVPNGPGQNQIATLSGVLAEQVVGQMHGLPVVTDPNMPTTLGASTNEDVIHVLRASDLLLWESALRTRVLPEVGSGTLTTRLQVYGYVAFTAARYPQSVVELGGTALATPAFA